MTKTIGSAAVVLALAAVAEAQPAPDAGPPPAAEPAPTVEPVPAAEPDPSEDPSTRLDEVDVAIDELDGAIREAARAAQAASPGTTYHLVTGYGFAGFASDVDGDGATFGAGFNPILLWRLTDRIFFEGELELELESEGTEAALEYAHGAWVISDLLTIGAGLFLSPVNVFAERLHPAWINKLPDAPLPFGHDGLLPGSELGVQGRGVVAIGRTARLTYAVAVSNGPVINDGMEEPEEAGMLMFDNLVDSNRDKALGGRVAIVLPASVEVGVAGQTADVGVDGTDLEDLRAVLVSGDVALGIDKRAIKGALEVRAQIVYSRVPRADFGGVTFDNVRTGGYAQVAYRPTRVGKLKAFETVARVDWLRGPEGSPEEIDQIRGTVGVDWWTTASTVVKAAFQRAAPAEGPAENTILAQAAIGF